MFALLQYRHITIITFSDVFLLRSHCHTPIAEANLACDNVRRQQVSFPCTQELASFPRTAALRC